MSLKKILNFIMIIFIKLKQSIKESFILKISKSIYNFIRCGILKFSNFKYKKFILIVLSIIIVVSVTIFYLFGKIKGYQQINTKQKDKGIKDDITVDILTLLTDSVSEVNNKIFILEKEVKELKREVKELKLKKK